MGKGLVCAIVLAVGLAVPAGVRSQSLADVARAEAERRKAIGKRAVKVYTNEDIGGERQASAPPEPATAAPTPEPAPGAAGAAAKPAPPPPADAATGRDEKYWRTRITTARANLERSQAFFDALQSHINGLYAEFVAMGDPIQRAAIEKKRLEAIAEQDRVKADIAAHTKAIAAIEDEARRASVPPGWLR